MAGLKRKGDLAELMVAADLVRQGHRVLFPYGEDAPYDLAVDRGGRLERIQVKHTTARRGVLEVRCHTHSITGGRLRTTHRYTSADVEWLAAFEPDGGHCFYLPADELGTGRSTLTLRLEPARNGQLAGVRMAERYRSLPPLP